MPSYIPVDYKKVTVVVLVVGVVCLSLGVMIGYLTGHKVAQTSPGSETRTTCNDVTSPVDSSSSSCDVSTFTDIGRNYSQKYAEQYSEGQCVHPTETCNTYGLPRTLLAYHLNGQTINVDGRLDDHAWQQVPFSENFVDIRSTVYPNPDLQTNVKVRWDDNFLYIGAYLQEHDVTGFMEEHDSKVYLDNEFEVLLDVDGTMTTYKQIQINSLGTTADTVYFSKYTSGNFIFSYYNNSWSAGIQKAVYINGTLNNPKDRDNYWSVEMAFGLKQLANHSARKNYLPTDNEVWFANFGRSEYHYRVYPGDTYVKDPGDGGVWTSWQPCGAINLHLQTRWGMIQFKRNMNERSFSYSAWHLYKPLFDVYNALKAYRGMNGRFIDQLEELTVSPYLFSRACVEVPIIEADFDSFLVTIRSRVIDGFYGQITENRFVTFGRDTPLS